MGNIVWKSYCVDLMLWLNAKINFLRNFEHLYRRKLVKYVFLNNYFDFHLKHNQTLQELREALAMRNILEMF